MTIYFLFCFPGEGGLELEENKFVVVGGVLMQIKCSALIQTFSQLKVLIGTKANNKIWFGNLRLSLKFEYDLISGC